MNRIIVALIALSLGILACEASSTTMPDSQGLYIVQPTLTNATPLATASRTPAPTATVGYAATINAKDLQLAAAQSTRDALARLQSDVTLEAAHVTEQAGQWTAEVFAAREQHIHETQTAATPAAIATTTRQAKDDAKTVLISTSVSSLLTATHELPTQVVAAARARAEAEYMPLTVSGTAVLQWGVGLLLIVLSPMLAVVLLYRVVLPSIVEGRSARMEAETADDEPAPAPMPVIAPVARTDGLLVKSYSSDAAGYIAMNAEEWPCTEEQFDELARHVESNSGRMIVRRFDGKAAGSRWTRDGFTRWREWAERHNPALVLRGREDGHYYASQTLRRLAHAYVDGSLSPTSMAFRAEDGELAVSAAHTRGPHTGTRGGGADLDGLLPLSQEDR